MVACMSVVAVGLASFYAAQFRVQGKRAPAHAKDPAEVPTCPSHILSLLLPAQADG